MSKAVTLRFKGSVISDLKSRDKYGAMTELIYRAPVFKRLKSNKKFIDAVFEREQIKNTGFGHGVAVAHGRDCSISEISLALGVSHDGIDYGAYDGKPVKFLFMIATPEANKDEYLRILASLMTVMRNKEFRTNLLKYNSPRKIEKKISAAFNVCLNGKKCNFWGSFKIYNKNFNQSKK
ncbi:MAG: PTS sugar transporter subunit IIA [Spirochaetales bacterium]|nr:PTS sugar transporter subunit IIA [Spirochaetales bacterium]